MSLETESDLLQRTTLFRSVNLSRCKLVAMSSDRLEFKAGDVVYAEGDVSDAVYIIIAGKVRATRTTADRVIDIGQIEGGAILGETGVITGRQRNATIIAATDTSMLRLDGRVFLEMLQQVPEVCYALTRELAERAERSEDRLARAVDGL